MQSIKVSLLLREKSEEWGLELLAGKEGLNREIISREVYIPGLLFAGYESGFPEERIQILGESELSFLQSLSRTRRLEVLEKFCKFHIPCVFITGAQSPLPELAQVCDRHGIPLLSTRERISSFIGLIFDYLSFKLAPSLILHGTLIDVFGVGILLTGRSGIGKSECALDLISRGHTFVADDLVKLIRYPENLLTGTQATEDENLKYFLELRGVGIIDIYSIFGIRAIRDTKRVEIHVELLDWKPNMDYERLGLKTIYSEFLGVKIPRIKLPQKAGKNTAMVLEVIALNYHLMEKGYHPAAYFEKNLIEKLREE